MPVAASDLKFYQSASMPENDTSTTGGAINTAGLVEFTDLATNDVVRAVSTAAGDTNRDVKVTGRTAAGAIVTDTIVLNGTTAVAGTSTFERILKVRITSTGTDTETAAAGTVTVERNTTPFDDVIAVPIGKTSVRRLFYDATSEAASTTRYEKFFIKNEHATLALGSATIKLTADPSASVRIGCAATKGDAATVANRKTSPGVTFVDDNVAQSIPTGSLGAAETIGVWVELVRGASAAAIKSSLTVEVAGTTT